MRNVRYLLSTILPSLSPYTIVDPIFLTLPFVNIIDPSHKSHNASDKYPTMHYFVTEMCTCVHKVLHCGKWDRCIVRFVQQVYSFGTRLTLVLYFSGLFENTVTFRKADATIEFPTFDAATSGDIRFQFKTTAENGVFLQNTGRFHFIEIKLLCRLKIASWGPFYLIPA